jgi:toxin HigB-1
MIQSIKHKGLKLFFEKGNSSKIQPTHKRRLRLILTLLHAAKDIKDMNYPGSNLHRLSGDFKNYWAVNVSGNWRIVFRFEKGEVFDVDYIDYH